MLRPVQANSVVDFSKTSRKLHAGGGLGGKLPRICMTKNAILLSRPTMAPFF